MNLETTFLKNLFISDNLQLGACSILGACDYTDGIRADGGNLNIVILLPHKPNPHISYI